MRISTVIPTYNEVENIKILVPQLFDVFERCSIDGYVIIVDDASTDGTSTVAEELSRKMKNIRLIKRCGKLGIGSAYKDGFRYALALGCDGIIEMDADLSHDSSYIPNLVDKLSEGYDLVIGSRYVPGGRALNWPISRRIMSQLTNWLIRHLFRLPTHDNTSGFRAHSRLALDTIDLETVTSEGYAFQVEMIIQCLRSNLKVCEIPITFVDRTVGRSKLSIREMWKFLKSVLSLAFVTNLET